MRILFLSNSIGALVNFRFELLQALVKRGDTVFLSSQIEKNATPKVLEDIGCKFIETRMNQRGTNPLDEFKLIKEYKRIISEVKPNIVMAYTIKPNIYGSVACRKLGVPVIANVTGIGMALENAGLLQKISVWLYRWGFKKTDFVFFQNQESIDFFAQNNIKPKAQSLIAGSGVNLEKFRFTDYPEDNGEINFMLIGRILPKKGIQQLIDAAMYCHEKYPKVKFHIVGYKDDLYYNQLVDEMDAKGIIKYHGQQTDIRPFVEMANALVHLDEYKNNLDISKNEFLKGLWDGTGRTRMNMDLDKKKETTSVDSGVIISGQEMPTADIALFSRLIFLTFSKCSFSEEEKREYQTLKKMRMQGMSHLTLEILKLRNKIEADFPEIYQKTITDVNEGPKGWEEALPMGDTIGGPY